MALTKRDKRRLTLAHRRLLALRTEGPPGRPCAVHDDTKRQVRPYLDSWVIPLLERVLNNDPYEHEEARSLALDLRAQFDAATKERAALLANRIDDGNARMVAAELVSMGGWFDDGDIETLPEVERLPDGGAIVTVRLRVEDSLPPAEEQDDG